MKGKLLPFWMVVAKLAALVYSAYVACMRKLRRSLIAVRDKNPLLYLFAKTWQYSVGNRLKVATFWLMFFIVELGDLWLMPYIWSKMINIPQEQGLTKSSMVTIMLLLLVTLLWTVLFWSMHGPARIMECSNAFRARANYRRHLLEGVMNLPMDWQVEHHSGETIDRAEKGANALFSFSEGSFEVIYALARLVGTYVMLTSQFKPAGVVVLVMMLVTGWIIIRFDKVLIPQYQSLNKAENRISESIFDALSNITTVIILRVEALVFKAIMRKVDEPHELFRNTSIRNEWKWFLVSVCCRITIIFILGAFLLQHYWRHEIVLGGAVYLIINYSQKMTDLFNRFAGMYGDIVQRRAKVANAELLSQDFQPVTFANHVLPPNWRRMEMRNIRFSYDGMEGDRLHLDGVSLRLDRGKTYAFVGRSGSGKTTLLKVMRDLYHPQSGALVVDGREVAEGFAGIARAIALVPQNPEIFATTVWENITLGAEYAFDLVQHYADMACFTEVVEELPHKYESKTKEKGVNLSGGQQQRLALTRGLLASHDKDLVLVDEPTSGLDATNEMRVYRNIFHGFAGKTIVSSVHRLHLLPLFHEIVMFEGGKIVGSGTLQHMLMNCPEFAELWGEYQLQ